jgi:hypothetical protein
MPDLGTLAAKMELKEGGFSLGLEQAKGAMEGFRGVAEKIGGVLGVLGISFAAFRGAEGFTEGLKGVFEFGKELQSQSAITHERISDLVVLRQAYKEAGLDAGSVVPSLVLLQKALGGVNDEGQPTKEIFKQLHLNMAQLKAETAIQQFQAISKAIGNLGDQASKTAAITAMFGRSGAQMEALFANPRAIDEAREAVGGMGAVMERNAATFTKISNAFELMGDQGQRFFAGFGSQIAPLLDSLLTKINKIDLTGLGNQVGGIVRGLSTAFANGDLKRLITASFQGGIADGLGMIGDVHTWEALGDLIKGAFTGLDAIILNAFKPALAVLGAMTAEAVSKLSGGQIDPQKDAAQRVYDNANQAITSIQAQQLAELENKKGLPQAEVDKRYNALEHLLAQQQSLKQTSGAMLGPGGPDIGDRTNFQGQILNELLPKFQDQSQKAFAEATKRWNQSLTFARDNGSPEFKAALKKLSDDLKKAMVPLAELAPAADKAAKGMGRIDAAKLPHEAGRGAAGRDTDRFQKIGLFIGGGGGPAGDYARRTADNTLRIAQAFELWAQKGNQSMPVRTQFGL